eukprot:TRINITY_DN4028_c2_g1_i1.p1 TRINITY_DN4028_c2_g1~~TRINITY_DN4028_c2_g1_i1.p1  ORF type:complete len:886 (+),score=286.50 TRINITY_DN4028_c2_g1_i1:119-2776(+)
MASLEDNFKPVVDDEYEYESEEDDGQELDSDLSEEESSEEEGLGDTGLTDNQGRLLYLISLHTRPAKTEKDKEEWMRKQALLVLIYESIVAQVLDYDYAPASELVRMRRKYFNISQEGKSDVDFLREEELINGLKLSSKEYQPVTCFQISEKGLEVMKRLPKPDKEAVEEVAFAPGSRDLLQVKWDGDNYFLEARNGYKRISTCTDCEDVSYVSSAYVPQCLRKKGRPTLSNAHRAHECGISNIRDELDEIITLNSVSIIVAEYIPFGANQIVQMNNNLGSTERVQGGFFTALIDDDASGTKFEVEPGLTSVNILDYSLTDHINFEADIHLPVSDGIVQVETFGVSMNAEGSIFYGMQIEAVMDRIKDNISLDHLSRLLVDVHIDSSTIVDSVISTYQRNLLNIIFLGDAENRDKVNLIIANEITPHLTALQYMDHGEYENELKQVLGDTRDAFDISEHDTLIFGEHGILVAGPNSRHHEPLLCSYLQFISMDLFVRNFFNRMFLVVDHIKNCYEHINESHKDPNSINEIRNEISKISHDIILLEETHTYLRESLEVINIPPEPPEQTGRALYERLDIHNHRDQLARRVTDLQKNLDGARHELEVLREQSNIVAEKKTLHITESISVNTKNLCDLQEANARSSSSLQVMQVVLAGSLAFDLMDRFTGEWTVVDTDWAKSIIDSLIRDIPLLWFFISLLFWAAGAFVLNYIMSLMARRAQGITSISVKINRQIHVEKLKEYLATKDIAEEDVTHEGSNDFIKVAWVETDKRSWGGVGPRIVLEFDEKNGFLLKAVLTYFKRKAKKTTVLNAGELRDRLMMDLNAAEIWRKEQKTIEQILHDRARSNTNNDMTLSQYTARNENNGEEVEDGSEGLSGVEVETDDNNL